MWENRKLILEGIRNKVFQTEAIEEVSASRTEICKGCIFYDTKGVGCAVKGTAPCCSSCGCSLAFKTRSLSSECPELKWGKVLTDEEDLFHEELNTKDND